MSVKLMRAIATCFKNDAVLQGKWPAPNEHGEVPDYIQQTDRWTLSFEFPVLMESYYGTEPEEYEEFNDVEGLPWIDDYDSGDTVTREEFEEWILANPTWFEDMQEAAKRNTGRIAELNKQVAALIDEMTELAEEAGIELEIDLGQHGSLDPDSDWNASRC